MPVYELLAGTTNYAFLPLHEKAPPFAESILHLTFDDEETNYETALKLENTFDTVGSNPAWITISPTDPALLLVATENHDAQEGKVATYRIGRPKPSSLELISRVGSGGGAVAYAQITSNGSIALVANYRGAVLASFSIAEDGQLSQEAQSSLSFSDPSHVDMRQEAAHAHSIHQHPKQSDLVYAADIGADAIRIAHLDDNGSLTLIQSVKTPPGSGPRQIAFHPSGQQIYVACELNHTLMAYNVSLPAGQLSAVQTVDLAAPDAIRGSPASDWVRLSCSAVRISDDGKFLYCGMRNDAAHPDGDCITVLQVTDTKSEEPLRVIQHIRAPRGGVHIRELAISPDGRYLVAGSLANGGRISIFARDNVSGTLTFRTIIEARDDKGRVHSPTSFVWMRSGE